MPQFKKLTPNLFCASVEKSLAFYMDVLGFERGLTVPDESPFVFASVTSGDVEIFFNDTAAMLEDHPAYASKLGVTGNTMFIELDGTGNIDALYERLKSRVKIAMPIVTQWYGMREFGIEDPDGYVITFAQRVQE